MDSRVIQGTKGPEAGMIRLARLYITAAGILGIGTGILGFMDNPFIGDPANGSIFATDALHNMIHVATGLLALWIGVGRKRTRMSLGIALFGVLYLVLFAVLLITPTLFGLMEVSVNSPDHVLHAGLGLATLAVGLASLRTARTLPSW
jgi:hypothetical protein